MEQVVGTCWECITEKKHHAELCLLFFGLSFDLLFVVWAMALCPQKTDNVPS